MARQLLKHFSQHRSRDFFAPFNGVRAIHQHLGFDDGDNVLFLTQRGIACQTLRVGLNGVGGREPGANIDDAAPLREARAQLVVVGQALAQAIETLGDGLIGERGHRLGAGVDLDARHHAEFA